MTNEQSFTLTDNNGVIFLDSVKYEIKVDKLKNLYIKKKEKSDEFVKFDELNKDKRYSLSEKCNILVSIYYGLEDVENRVYNDNE